MTSHEQQMEKLLSATQLCETNSVLRSMLNALTSATTMQTQMFR